MSAVVDRQLKAAPKAKAEQVLSAQRADRMNRLQDNLELAKVFAGTLFSNLIEPRMGCSALDIPGAFDMVEAVPFFLDQAQKQANELGLDIPEIRYAWSLALHLNEMSCETKDGRGFNPGDHWVGMCYWAIETTTQIANEKSSNGGAQ